MAPLAKALYRDFGMLRTCTRLSLKLTVVCYTDMNMQSNLSSRNTLACFSPPVMIATFFIEVGLALYVLWRYGLNNVSRLAILILVMLAIFQLAEYNICETSLGLSSLDWARIGFVAITLLPPLGIHLATEMAGKVREQWKLLMGVYSLAIGFAIAFLTVGHGMQGGAACMGNYAIFHVSPTTIWLYGYYYYGLLLLGIWLALYYGRKARQRAARYAQHALIIGYLAFLTPTTTVNLLNPSTISGIPSVMCGFAVLLALVIVGYVLPADSASRKKPKRS